MIKRKHMIWFVMLGLYFSCSSPGSTPQRSTAYTVDYEEDLAVHRTVADSPEPDESSSTSRPSGTLPEQTVTVSNDITSELDRLSEDVAAKNKSIKSIPGFRVQIYSGNSREMAYQLSRQVYNIIPDAQPEVKYQPPNYKVQVGQFTERLQAQKTFSLLKKEFPSALIIPDRIQINK